jgi:predicted metal-dependent hydrolase
MSLFGSPRYADGDSIEVDGTAVRLRVSGRARRVSLRVDSARREVVAVAPTPRRLGEAAAFALERRAWIAARLAELPSRQSLAPGTLIQLIQVLGQPCRLEAKPGRARWRPADSDGPMSLSASGQGEAFDRAVVRALKAEARRVLGLRTEAWAAAVERPTPMVSVADPRARWGSCRPPRRAGFGAEIEVGRVRYSWRLVLAPWPVMDYVAAHECAHLVEANHSARFWAIVHDLVGDHRPHRAWLRANGARLHGFGGT